MGSVLSQWWNRVRPCACIVGYQETHNVRRLSAHPNHSPVDPSQQPLHDQLYVC